MAPSLRYPTTFSGVRPGEAAAVKSLIDGAGLPVADLDGSKWRHYIVARRGDAIVGAVGLAPVGESALLRSLVVAPDCRGEAIASRLVAAIEKYARSHGVVRLYLLTTSAAAFFLRRGYREIPRREAPATVQATAEFRSLCPATATCLSKTL